MSGKLNSDNFKIIVSNLNAMAIMAYGSRRSEGVKGGNGNIGYIDGKVIKFNTHAEERRSSTTTDEMIQCCNALKESIKDMLLTLSQDARIMDERKLKNVCKELGFKVDKNELDKSYNITYNDKKLLTRKCVARALARIVDKSERANSNHTQLDLNDCHLADLDVWSTFDPEKRYITLENSKFENVIRNRNSSNSGETKGAEFKREDWMFTEQEQMLPNVRSIKFSVSTKPLSEEQKNNIAADMCDDIRENNKKSSFTKPPLAIAEQQIKDVNRDFTFNFTRPNDSEGIKLRPRNIAGNEIKRKEYINQVMEKFPNKNKGMAILFLSQIHQRFVQKVHTAAFEILWEKLNLEHDNNKSPLLQSVFNTTQESLDGKGDPRDTFIGNVTIDENGGFTMIMDYKENYKTCNEFIYNDLQIGPSRYSDNSRLLTKLDENKSYGQFFVTLKFEPLTENQYNECPDDKNVGFIDYSDPETDKKCTQYFRIKVESGNCEFNVAFSDEEGDV